MTDNKCGKFEELAQSIAEGLGGTVEKVGVRYDTRFTLQLLGHAWAKILLRFDAYNAKGRIKCSHIYPWRNDQSASPSYLLDRSTVERLKLTESITVSYDREADKIVADIRRRLLPNLIEALTLMEAACKELDDQAERRWQTFERLAAAMGIEADKEYCRHRDDHRAYIANPSVDLTVRSDSLVKIDINRVAPEKAEAILKILLDK